MTASSESVVASKGPLVLESSSPRSPSPPLPSQAGRVSEWWAQAWRDTHADFKATTPAGWRQALLRIIFSCLTMGLLGTVIFVTVLFAGLSGSAWYGSACRPDDSFSVYQGFDYWRIDGFFQITLPLIGPLDFTQAKVVDIIWDLAVGKGGQAFLAFFSWKAFSTYVRSAMHTGPVTYSSFFAVFLESDASPMSTYRITRDFTTRGPLRSKLAMACIVATMAFIIAWPTLASAMTGYAPATQAFVLDIENNLISFGSFTTVAYVIHDGQRVNRTKDYLVPYEHRGRAYGCRSGDDDCVYSSSTYYDEPSIDPDGWITDYCGDDVDTPACSLLAAVSEYTKEYGFLALDKAGNLNDIETRWMNQTIGKPALNISAFYVPPYGGAGYGSGYYGYNWTDPRTNQTPYNVSSNRAFMTLSGNTAYSVEYVEKNGTCQGVGNTYQWGFSFLQLFIVELLLLLWIAVMYTMWLKGHLDLKQRHGGEVPAKFKAVLELAAALNHGLADIGEPPDGLTNRQLERYISKQLNGGRVAMEMPSSASGYSFRKGAWGWIKRIKREKWWVVLFMVAVFISAFPAVWLRPLIPFAFFAIFAASVILALAIGRTRASRVFICLAGLIISLCLVAGAGFAVTTWSRVRSIDREGDIYAKFRDTLM
ncbi:uncharacterized protein B0H64DRAFT_346694 [Chaetomium fimeti]|uniref:Uncharacterized protein n=1 Tax=Chaetomium fimeti TaxID=1854472 RepID=A0AAE0H8X7_9PEZI|nr:hypothetical protein B0H64DRAFT_346694 [Chaetomium fimeti]